VPPAGRGAGGRGTRPGRPARAARLNEIFFTYVARRTPFVALKAGMTLDGKIALPSRRSRWITGDTARDAGRRLRGRYDAVLVGIETVLADDPRLLAETPERAARRKRRRGGTARSRPVRVVLDAGLRLPAARSSRGPRARIPSSSTPRSARRVTGASALEALGVVGGGGAAAAGNDGRLSLPAVLADLASRELTSVFVEGGSSVLGSFLSGGHVDKLHLFVAPRLLGGQDALSVAGGAAPLTLDETLDLEITEMHDVGGDVCLTAYPRTRRAEPLAPRS
jgi:diaminohydroxyphosphoribosylaminopyrimidine deaminase/5-amino-6-(5-phosphoribosylamino)uracil reductase